MYWHWGHSFSVRVHMKLQLTLVNLKGVSRNLDVCFWCHSIDLTLLPLTKRVCLLLKFFFHSEFFDFLCLGVRIVSLLCDSIWSTSFCRSAVLGYHYGIKQRRFSPKKNLKLETGPVQGFCSPVLIIFTTVHGALITSFVKTIEKYSVLGQNPSSTHRVDYLRRDTKIQKFYKKTKFKKQANRLHKG
jgi:hypothetical protein